MSAISRTGLVTSLAQAQYNYKPLVEGACLYMHTTGEYIGPIRFAWSTSYTLFFKANIFSVPNNAARIISDPASGQGMLMTSTAIQVTNKFANGTSGSGFLTLNEWHDYCVVYDGTFGIVQFFKDGYPHSAALLAVPFTSTFNYYIFNRSDGLRNCNMNVCELQWYNRALTQVEVASHYRSDPNNTDSLLFRYQLHEGSGTTIKDKYNALNNTTQTGGSWSTFSINPADYYNGLSTYGDVPNPARSYSPNTPNATHWTKTSGNNTNWG